MSRTLVLSLLPLVGGALIAAQAPINARLRIALDSPVGSAFVSFAIGTLVLLVGLAVVADVGTTAGGLGGAPWWAYLGGLCGAVFVFATLVASPRIGVTTTFVAVVLGQVAAAVIIDRLGLFGVAARAINWERLVALGLLAAAVVLLGRGA